MGGANPLNTSPLIDKLFPILIPPLIDAVAEGKVYIVFVDDNTSPLIDKLVPTRIPPLIDAVDAGNV